MTELAIEEKAIKEIQAYVKSKLGESVTDDEAKAILNKYCKKIEQGYLFGTGTAKKPQGIINKKDQ